MNKALKGLSALAVAGMVAVGLGACSSDADVASHNLSKDADNFQIQRKVVFYNGITGQYILEVDGLCSVGNGDKSQEVSITCKVGKDKYVKHFLGISDNVTWFAEQTRSASASTQNYKVIWKPSQILPDFDAR